MMLGMGVVPLAQERVNMEEFHEHPVEGSATFDERPDESAIFKGARRVDGNCIRLREKEGTSFTSLRFTHT